MKKALLVVFILCLATNVFSITVSGTLIKIGIDLTETIVYRIIDNLESKDNESEHKAETESEQVEEPKEEPIKEDKSTIDWNLLYESD